MPRTKGAAHGRRCALAPEEVKRRLYAASCGGWDDEVRWLLTAPGADVNAPLEDGVTALMMASVHGHTKAVRALLGVRGVNVDNQGDVAWTDGRTPLAYASIRGHVDVVKALVGSRADVNVGDVYGNTPLHCAAKRGLDAVAEVLLGARGVQVNAVGHVGKTALLCAAEHGRAEIVRRLLEVRGIDVKARDDSGRSALALARLRGHEHLEGLFDEEASEEEDSESESESGSEEDSDYEDEAARAAERRRQAAARRKKAAKDKADLQALRLLAPTATLKDLAAGRADGRVAVGLEALSMVKRMAKTW